MPNKILVASSNPAFGELIRISLEEDGKFRVRLVPSIEQALQQAREGNFDLAILDCDLPGSRLNGHNVLKTAEVTHLRKIVIPPDNNPQHPALQGVEIDAYLTKPFYLPDLLDTLERLLGEEPSTAEAKPQPAVEQPVQAAQPAAAPVPVDAQLVSRLEKLIASSEGKAGVLVNGQSLLAAAGPQVDQAGPELLQWISQSYDPSIPGDLTRFQRYPGGSEGLQVARTIEGQHILGIAWDPALPLSKARKRTAELARQLTTAEPEEQPQPTVPDNFPVSSPDETEERELPDFNLTELLASMPSPDPDDYAPASPTSQGWEPEQPFTPAEGEIVLPWEVHYDEEQPAPLSAPNLSETIRSTHLAETRPMGSVGTRGDAVQPIAPALPRPGFTCILIPAKPEHKLTGSVAGWLEGFIPPLCQAFGWQLEDLLVQPDYLQWSVLLPPAVSPSYLVRLIRKQSSAGLLAQFSASRSGDFWAPGYLIVSGLEPPAPRLLQDFIAQTRRRQGLPAA